MTTAQKIESTTYTAELAGLFGPRQWQPIKGCEAVTLLELLERLPACLTDGDAQITHRIRRSDGDLVAIDPDTGLVWAAKQTSGLLRVSKVPAGCPADELL
jgi:hypothetical protein